MKDLRSLIAGYGRTWAVLVVAGAGQYFTWLAAAVAAPGDWATETIELGSPEALGSAGCRTLHGLVESQDDVLGQLDRDPATPGKAHQPADPAD